MARPSKTKEVCMLPRCTRFTSTNKSAKKSISLTVEEYECIRLIDYLNCSQEEVATGMNVARTTVTRLYESARKKLAQYIIEGKELKIEGGSYNLCSTRDCDTCPKRLNRLAALQNKEKKEI